jgi:hypothetical protein
MTFEVDNEALKLAMARHYEEKLTKELREMFVYSSNPDTARIWQLYLEEVARKEESKANNQENLGKPFASGVAFTILGWILILYGLWHLFT